jgi:hypothetical protein
MAKASREKYPNDKTKRVDIIVFDFEQKRPVPNLVVKEVNFKDQLYVRLFSTTYFVLDEFII